MANIIKIKRKITTGAPPLASLEIGEGCLVIPDDTLYYKKDANTLIAFRSVSYQITYGTAEPTGGNDGDIYLKY